MLRITCGIILLSGSLVKAYIAGDCLKYNQWTISIFICYDCVKSFHVWNSVLSDTIQKHLIGRKASALPLLAWWLLTVENFKLPIPTKSLSQKSTASLLRVFCLFVCFFFRIPDETQWQEHFKLSGCYHLLVLLLLGHSEQH